MLNNIDALQSFIEQIEAKHGERKYLNEEIRQIYQEIRDAGMHPGTVRQMVRERRLDADVRREQYRLRDEYRRAIGLLEGTPLGDAGLDELQREADALADKMAPGYRADAMADALAGKSRKPFAEQAVHKPRRRARKLSLFNADHPQGTA